MNGDVFSKGKNFTILARAGLYQHDPGSKPPGEALVFAGRKKQVGLAMTTYAGDFNVLFRDPTVEKL